MDILDTLEDIELSAHDVRTTLIDLGAVLADAITAVPTQTHSGANTGQLELLLPEVPPGSGGGVDVLRWLVKDFYLPNIRNYRHPLHYGHQRPAPLAATVIADLAANAFNPSVTMLESGPVSVAVERRVLDWLRQLAGFPEAGCATMVNGGAESTLTAMLVAREQCGAGHILASDNAHYSVARAAHVLGLGSDAVVRIPVDRAGRMRPSELRRIAEDLKSRSARIMAVVANAGSTANSAFDDLETAAAVAAAHGAWFHVDGAHGASALLSAALRRRLKGVQRADSLSWDPHKMLWVSPPCSVLIVKDQEKLVAALAPGLETASYVLPAAAEGRSAPKRAEDDPLRLTLACTRFFSALRLCAALMVYGTDGLARRIERSHELAIDLFERLKTHAEFEVYSEPELNMVCFRHRPADQGTTEQAANAHNRAIRARLAAGADAYLTGVEIGGRYWLRAQVISPNSTRAGNAQLIDIVLREAGLLADQLAAGRVGSLEVPFVESTPSQSTRVDIAIGGGQ